MPQILVFIALQYYTIIVLITNLFVNTSKSHRFSDISSATYIIRVKQIKLAVLLVHSTKHVT